MKAIALISGGLDSILAARLIKEQSVDVIGLHFAIPFCLASKKKSSSSPRELAQDMGIEFRQVKLEEDFLSIVQRPRYGYGSNINPCIDCKILMLRKAKELMKEWQAGFIVTGEVLGQRPMSQNRPALELIDKKSGLYGYLLRPLSAKLLEETIPEKEGWVSRDRLLGFNGRSRKAQMELAKTFALEDYPNPAGGCLLTDPQFAKRVKDLIDHNDLNPPAVELLKVGRHFRLSEKAKLVVGRNEKENLRLGELAQAGDYLFMPAKDVAGPVSLGRGFFGRPLLELACGISCRYCDLADKTKAEMFYRLMPNHSLDKLEVAATGEEQLVRLRL